MISILDMAPGIFYMVVKDSDDKTFRVGDSIYRDKKDGSIFCIDAGGWINNEDVPTAIAGMEIKVDRQHYIKEKARLENELRKISSLV